MKKIVVVSMSRQAAEGYKETLLEIFGKRKITVSNAILEEEPIPQDGDLYLISKGHIENRFCTPIDERVDFPLGMPTIDIIVEFRKKDMEPLACLKKGTKCLLVNSTEMLAMECISDLYNTMGIYHLILLPYCGGGELYEDGIDTAITVGEPELVPDCIENVIDLGFRYISPETIAEIAVNLKLEEVLETEVFKEYKNQFAESGMSVSSLASKSEYYKNFLHLMIECLEDGIIGINAEHKIFCANKKSADILHLRQNELLGEAAEKALPFINLNSYITSADSTTLLLKYKGTELNVFLNPIIVRGKTKGILLVVQPFYEQEMKQSKARLKLFEKGYRAKYTFSDIVGEGPRIRETCSLAKKMALSDSTVLITGETGTGKELLASAIHNASPRRNEPYIAINCSAISDNLLESELFGYDEGAFTGAKKSGKLGMFEYAHRGTLFLDEIEDMSPALQLKLLRVLQEKEIMHIGGDRIIKVDVRIIAATNQDAEKLVSEGKIRKDLYYRLNTLQLDLPPLRERREDILPIMNHIMMRNHSEFRLDKAAEEFLLAHSFEGNVRELENYVEYFACLQKEVINCADLPRAIQNKYEKKEEREVLLVLQILYESYQARQHIGRGRICQLLEDRGVFLSEQQIRAVIQKLEERGLVTVMRGRGGSKLTTVGAEYCRKMELVFSDSISKLK